ncbi:MULTISPECIES: sensor histidine kinase [Shewanella]|jgi:two-component system LytT family sensor kinase|uniref:histidine kinase n=1 Tax=Shewanella chilikensis TaxID=558541 RepID=A0A6G7LTU6_9GAMM|nr:MULTISPECIES: sensor histidine kinase [Shewanella]MBZ4679700.1 sensor histidine kinase [Shewanella sp.]MCA0949717.1 sensor histidine kinase [Shewanella chilikensis]MCL1155650.1 sensor histidine kinase [Shewanella chilikensis]MCL1163379.1 sensor histidine kinase [Shewanella chilikensis]PYE54670.1 signal transduction histidine kinase LytS [Shewanella chilikensis]
MSLILLLTQQMSLYLVIVYLVSKTPLFKLFTEASTRLPHKIFLYLVFSGFCIMATYFGEQTHGAIANTRAMGAVLGGLLGGPTTGLLVGLTGGLHRYSLGGFTDLACAVSTTLEGLSAGMISYYLRRQGKAELVFNPILVCLITFYAEMMQMSIILLLAEPFDEAWGLVRQIAPPMLLVNSIGAALFMSMVRDQKTMFDKLSSSFSTKALKIAERSVGLLSSGFNEETSTQVAKIVIEETNVGAVAITDREKLLAFIGIGADHHLPGTLISSQITLDAIHQNKVMFADGVEVPYACSISPNCKLGSSLVIPLRSDNEVIGTIKLYEPKNKLFLNINRTLGEGIARLLSNQILYGRFEQQQNLLTQAELKLLQAQVNPHFLFNALNTIGAIIRRDPPMARTLLQQLSQFLRINLKRTAGLVTLGDELEHIEAYLTIEKARFIDKLEVDIAIPQSLLTIRVPAFTLQPIIENAVKHGTSHLIDTGRIRVEGRRTDDRLILEVTDNAGLYQPAEESDGLGMNLVHKRIQNLFGPDYGVSVECQSDSYTRVSIHLPITETAL